MSVQLEERVALLEAEVEWLKHQMPNIPAKTEHPMLKFAGIFKDDADFAAVVLGGTNNPSILSSLSCSICYLRMVGLFMPQTSSR